MEQLISVIVTVYNEEKYIAKCLDSILGQTYRNLEIIVIDDGSSDSSAGICDEYAQKDDRIKIVHKQNEGLVRARKTGVKLAQGEYIGYVDGDDWIDSDMYERLLALAAKHSTDLVCSGRIEEYDQKSVVGRNKIPEGYYSKQEKEQLYHQAFFSGVFFQFGIYPTVWDKLFKRELLIRNQELVPDEIVVGEDVACTLPCLLEADSVYVSSDCWYHYRKHENSMLRTKDSRYNERVYILQQYLFSRLQDHPKREIFMPQVRAYIADMILNGARMEYDFRYELSYFHQYLFPFELIEKNAKIVIYGAGHVGQIYYRQVTRSKYCEVVSVIDQKTGKRDGLDVIVKSVPEINNVSYDVIVVAILDQEVAQSVRQKLVSMGVSDHVIIWRNPVI